MKKDNKAIKFIFVTGPSESGKSGGIIHIREKFPQVKHLKIRNIFSEVYKDSGSTLPYEEWYAYESENNFCEFWDNYIKKASEMSDNAELVIMDTMYGVKTIQYLSQKLGPYVGVLYIDAPEEERIRREYERLRTDSPYSDRKADLSITLEQVAEKTRRKDEQKRKLGAFKFRDLCYDSDGTLVVSPDGPKFSYVIDNNGTLEEFYAKLDRFINGHQGMFVFLGQRLIGSAQRIGQGGLFLFTHLSAPPSQSDQHSAWRHPPRLQAPSLWNSSMRRRSRPSELQCTWTSKRQSAAPFSSLHSSVVTSCISYPSMSAQTF